ncbi:MAG: hypothetical protein IPJ88_15600 [Myxococcales bacterium]|nr:MAG: hypothetical protein IPJ88_15600 [Myxococcales bacterium]
MKFIWLALCVSIPMYAVIGFIVASSVQDREPSFLIPNTVIMMVVVGASLASMLIRRTLISEARLETFLQADPRPEIRPMLEGLGEQEQLMLRVPGWVTAPLLISWALHESIAVFGLVVVFGAGTLKEAWVLFVFALVLNVLAYPRFSEYYAMAKQVASKLNAKPA